MGLAGDDDFRLKVSANGSSWLDAIHINRATGVVSLPNTPSSGGNFWGRALAQPLIMP